MISLLVLALAFLGAQADYPTSCPAGYIKANYPNYIFCYKAYNNLYTRAQAASQCKADGASLVMIDSPALNTILANATTALGSVYLGVNCSNTTSCIYDDGRAVKSLDYFYGGVPTPNVGSCVIMETANGLFYSKWVSVSCSSNVAFICQYEVDDAYYRDHRYTGCGASFHLNTPVTIYSPNYPQNYPNNLNCAYFFYSTTRAIRYTINDFQTEGGYDPFTIYSMGLNGGPPLTAVYSTSGYSTAIGYNSTINSNNGVAIFATDDSNTYKGFSITFSSV